jgi:Na+/proline symporter
MHAPTAHAGRDVSFGALIEKVKQAETALEANERQTVSAWRQLKATWIAGWTPGRIVIAGFLSGFVVGKAEPVRRVARGGGTLQLLSALAGLFAGGSAQAAAGEAEQAAKSAEQTAAAVSPEAALAVSAQHAAQPVHGPGDA